MADVPDDLEVVPLDDEMLTRGMRLPELKNLDTNPVAQWAAWLRCNYPTRGGVAIPREEFAERIGRGRSSVYGMLAGVQIPPVTDWPAIAKACKLGASAWSMVPPAEFLARCVKTEAKRRKRDAAARAAS